MSYRKIKIANVEYQYVVGKTHTKVRGLGVVKNELIESYSMKGLRPCGCEGCNCEIYEYAQISHVKPSDVSAYIIAIASGKKITEPMNLPKEGFEVGKVYNL